MDDVATRNPILANLFGLNMWANLALIDACAALGPAQLEVSVLGISGTIRAELWRIITVEQDLLAALTGEADAGQARHAGSPDGELSTLRVCALDAGEGLIAWAESVDGDPIVDGKWGERSYRAPASVFAGEALLDAAERRGRIQAALASAGIAPPNLTARAWWESLQAVGMESATI